MKSPLIVDAERNWPEDEAYAQAHHRLERLLEARDEEDRIHVDGCTRRNIERRRTFFREEKDSAALLYRFDRELARLGVPENVIHYS